MPSWEQVRWWVERTALESERPRRLLLHLLLTTSILASCGVAYGPQQVFLEPSHLATVKLALTLWAALQVALFFVSRRRLHLASVVFLSGSFVTLLLIFRSITLALVPRLGTELAYHIQLMLAALLLLPFRHMWPLVGALSSLRVVGFVLELWPFADRVAWGAFANFALPTFLVSALAISASLLLDRYHHSLIAAKEELQRHNERLEQEVAARTAMIERQREQMFQMQKMEAIGTLAAGVAHDFNNLLTPILGYASELKRLTEPGDEIRAACEVIERAASRAALLTHQLLGFARQGKLQSIPVDIHRLIKDVASFVRRTIDRRIDTRLDLRARLAVVEGDPSQLQQILLNLAVNARDAIGGAGGQIVFCTEELTLDEAACRGRERLQPGRHVVLSVTDSGCGIAPEVRPRIFEPFFTTKKQGEGTGMGLAMAYGIVVNHGGAIEVESELGKGSTFRVLLPACEVPIGAADPLPAAQPGGKGRVLLVDDEPLVLQTTERLLRQLGYEVATANDGAEALEYFGRHPGEVDLVVLDELMPRMDGLTCLRELRTLAGEVRVVVSTGHGDGAVMQAFQELGARAVVHKPYVGRELAEALRKALAT